MIEWLNRNRKSIVAFFNNLAFVLLGVAVGMIIKS